MKIFFCLQEIIKASTINVLKDLCKLKNFEVAFQSFTKVLFFWGFFCRVNSRVYKTVQNGPNLGSFCLLCELLFCFQQFLQHHVCQHPEVVLPLVQINLWQGRMKGRVRVLNAYTARAKSPAGLCICKHACTTMGNTLFLVIH